MNRYRSWSGTNRYLCDVLEEMRKCSDKKNYSYLDGLIEEAQTYANRMEAGLYDGKDIKEINEEKRKLIKQFKKLEKKVEKLKNEEKKLKKRRANCKDKK